MTGPTTTPASRSTSSGASRSRTTSAVAAARKSTTASAARPRRWKLAHERKEAKEPNAAYIKVLFDRYPNVSQGEQRLLVRASSYYGLPVDYPRPEFNEEDRRESYDRDAR